MRRVLRGLGIASVIVALSTLAASAAPPRGGGHGAGFHSSSGGSGVVRRAPKTHAVQSSRPVDGREHHDRDFVIGLGFGAPFFWDGWWWGDPFWWGPWYPAYPSYRVVSGNLLPVDVSVRPYRAEVILDGHYVGQARDFGSYDHPLLLTAGTHVVELRYPGYRTLRVDVDAEQAVNTGLRFRLRKGSGLDEIHDSGTKEPGP